MPRADSKQHLGTQFYHSQFSNSPYLPPDSPASSPQLSQTSAAQSPTSTASPAPKKKHVCATCERAFTTSGHLARHSRVHTGERNHKCPFPGCETRCSRQDNLQQHYRIHLSPGSRRSSARSAASKAMNVKKGNVNIPPLNEPPSAPTHLSPPPLETARTYNHHSAPPDSPPALTQATLPATASIPLTNSRIHQPSPGRSSSSSSPDLSYPPSDQHLVSLQSQGLSNPPNYNYSRTHHSSPGRSSSSSSPGTSYPPNEHHLVSMQSQALPNPPSYNYRSGTATYQEQSDFHPYHHHHHQQQHGNGVMSNHHHQHPQQQQQHHHPQPHLLPQQNDNHYHSNGHSNGRFNSPPLTLAPIQGERLIRRDDSRHSQNHNTSSYIHPSSVSDYSYHQGMGLGHGAWKAESGMRKGLGAALV